MDLKELKQRKYETENQIQKLLTDFEKETECVISETSIEVLWKPGSNWDDEKYFNVNLKVLL